MRLALGLGLSNAAFLGNETILDYLVNVLLLAIVALEIEVAHVLADVGLVDTLGVAMLVPLVHHVLVVEHGWIDTVRVGRVGSLLLSLFDLVPTQEDTPSVYLLESYVSC